MLGKKKACEHSALDLESVSGSNFRGRSPGLIEELPEVQAVAGREIARLGRINLLLVLEHFEGWERQADWGDLAFYAAHDKDIEKIAIVGEEKWRDHGLAFAGAGIRKAAVQFFPPAEGARA